MHSKRWRLAVLMFVLATTVSAQQVKRQDKFCYRHGNKYSPGALANIKGTLLQCRAINEFKMEYKMEVNDADNNVFGWLPPDREKLKQNTSPLKFR